MQWMRLWLLVWITFAAVPVTASPFRFYGVPFTAPSRVWRLAKLRASECLSALVDRGTGRVGAPVPVAKRYPDSTVVASASWHYGFFPQDPNMVIPFQTTSRGLIGRLHDGPADARWRLMPGDSARTAPSFTLFFVTEPSPEIIGVDAESKAAWEAWRNRREEGRKRLVAVCRTLGESFAHDFGEITYRSEDRYTSNIYFQYADGTIFSGNSSNAFGNRFREGAEELRTYYFVGLSPGPAVSARSYEEHLNRIVQAIRREAF